MNYEIRSNNSLYSTLKQKTIYGSNCCISNLGGRSKSDQEQIIRYSNCESSPFIFPQMNSFSYKLPKEIIRKAI